MLKIEILEHLYTLVVLRKDINNNKKYGLIIDLNAKSTLKVCERMIKYFNIPLMFIHGNINM